MSSRRVPGKVLRKLGDQPLLAYVVERCQGVRSADIVAIVTSTDSTDDRLDSWARARGVTLFRGSLSDVAGRFREATETYALDAFLRVNADSPFIDPGLLDHAVELYRSDDADLVTNVFPRSYPVGLSVELIARSTLAKAMQDMTDSADLEHVTRAIYRNSANYRIRNFSAPVDLSDRTLAVDNPGDISRLERLLEGMNAPHWEYGAEDICTLADALGVLTSRRDEV